MQHKHEKNHKTSSDETLNSNDQFDTNDVNNYGSDTFGGRSGHKDNNLETVSELHTDSLKDIETAEQKNITELEQKITELKDLYIRSQAEIQNMQKRSQEEIKKARDYAITNFAKDIVIVKDYLEMALKDQSGNFETMKTGVDLTLKQLIQVFERQLIKEIDPKPQDKLDPHLHQAMSSIEAPDQEVNTIVNVLQKGYMINERILRPAMVVVAK